MDKKDMNGWPSRTKGHFLVSLPHQKDRILGVDVHRFQVVVQAVDVAAGVEVPPDVVLGIDQRRDGQTK